MKYAITGHTSGIGKYIYEKLQPNIIGFSKSTGYDITIPEHRFKMIAESEDCDIFINNAHCGFGQVYLFLEIFKKWRNSDKIIINVGSNVTEHKYLSSAREYLLHYQAEKIALKEMSDRVQGKCVINYRTFGYVGTESILKKYPHFTSKDYISLEQAADIILT